MEIAMINSSRIGCGSRKVLPVPCVRFGAGSFPAPNFLIIGNPNLSGPDR